MDGLGVTALSYQVVPQVVQQELSVASGTRISDQTVTTKILHLKFSTHSENSFVSQRSQATGSIASVLPGRMSSEQPGVHYFTVRQGGRPTCNLQRAQGKTAEPSVHGETPARLGKQGQLGWAGCSLQVGYWSRRNIPFKMVPLQKQLQTSGPARFGLSGYLKAHPICVL